MWRPTQHKRSRTASDRWDAEGRVRDAQPDRSLLEQYRHGARRRGGAGSGDGRSERRVSVAVSVQTYAGGMGERGHRFAAVGAANLLEALRGNPPSQVEA